MDNLTEVTDAAGHSIGMLYDRLGRKTSVHDPDMGEWHYSYDAAGNLAAQVDANSQAISFYDELNRLKGKTYVAGVAVPAEYGRGSDPAYGGYDIATPVTARLQLGLCTTLQSGWPLCMREALVG